MTTHKVGKYFSEPTCQHQTILFLCLSITVILYIRSRPHVIIYFVIQWRATVLHFESAASHVFILRSRHEIMSCVQK